MSKFHVLTLRAANVYPAFACVIEYEDVLCSCLHTKPIGLEQLKSSDISVGQSYEPNYLFLSAISFGEVLGALNEIKSLLPRFDGIYVYVFDSIIFPNEKAIPIWRRQYSYSFLNAKKISTLFVPSIQAVNEFQKHYNIQVKYMPLGVDASQFGGCNIDKWIDVNGYGRQDESCSKLLSEHFNAPSSQRNYYHTDHFEISALRDVYAHRRFFWKFLRSSKIALAFDPMYANAHNRFTFSFVGQRWFESAAAGCVIVGKRPTCEEMGQLFPWMESTIEIPTERDSFLPFIISLLEDQNRLKSIGLRNFNQTLKNHDWRVRILSMLHELKIDAPVSD